jgi:hypothetical protein
MSWRTLACIVLLSCSCTTNLFSAQGYGLSLVTCDVEFHFSMCKSAYTKRGPKLKSRPYAAYDQGYVEHHGDSLAFHANGLFMPNIQPEFLASVFFSVAPGKHHANDVLEVSMKLFDNRRNSARGIEETILFAPNTQFAIELPITNQNDLWFERKSNDDNLRVVTMNCRR